MAEPGQHLKADRREATELKRLEAARDAAHLPQVSPALEGEEAGHPPGFAKPHESRPDRKHRGPQLRRDPEKPKPGKEG